MSSNSAACRRYAGKRRRLPAHLENTLRGITFCALAACPASSDADSRLYLSAEDLRVETDSLIVRHTHTTRLVTLPSGESGVELKSILELHNKVSGEVVSREVMPMTALTSIGRGYVVALSDLKAFAPEYNFLLLDPQGRTLLTLLVTGKSGHCRSVKETVTNFRKWFDRNDPKVTAVFQHGELEEVLVENPHDREQPSVCRIRVRAE